MFMHALAQRFFRLVRQEPNPHLWAEATGPLVVLGNELCDGVRMVLNEAGDPVSTEEHLKRLAIAKFAPIRAAAGKCPCIGGRVNSPLYRCHLCRQAFERC